MIDFKYGVALGPIDRVHKDRMRAWRNDMRVYSWCRQNDLISDFQQDRWMEAQSQDGSQHMYSVLVNTGASHEFCGVAGLTNIDWANRRAEFSLYIAPSMHRKGLGQKALMTLVTHAFLNLGLHVVWGETFAENPALRMFKRVGFQEEGIRRDFYFKKGRFIHAHLVSMTEAEWRIKYMSSSSSP